MSNITYQQAQKKLNKFANLKKADNYRIFFKNSRDDIFWGVTASNVKKVAKEFHFLPLTEIRKLMQSKVHDQRALANAILCLQYKKGDDDAKEKIYRFYIKNKNLIRDWDSVDDSAPYIVGPYLLNRDKKILYKLMISKRIWDRRIAIVSTWWFIRQGKYDDTMRIAKKLLKDKEDLIHKATGWMLREVCKRDKKTFQKFIDKYHKNMPRTALRYAIERLSPVERKKYLSR